MARRNRFVLWWRRHWDEVMVITVTLVVLYLFFHWKGLL
jgi:hypothetical protein